MKRASIDIGTNSVLLLVAEIQSGSIRVIDEKQEIPRLGKSVDSSMNLHQESIERVLKVLTNYKDFLQNYYPEVVDEVIVTATSAVRDASNRDEFIGYVKKSTGWAVRLLSGDEEAQTTFKGALSVLNGRENTNNVILDIGGGSTEIAYGAGLKLDTAFSIDMGSVRFTERFFDADPPHAESIQTLRNEVKRLLFPRFVPFSQFDAIGVAGTVTSIAAIKKGLQDYDAKALNGFRLQRDDVIQFIGEFSSIPASKIEQRYPPFLTGRGDVILAGILILDEFMQWCGKNEMIVSTGGIRHGIITF
ncbi:MAG: Ppx/GppA family phosphatase [Balneolaceae bacterium]|nr:Ppx/GppA family phosphatase [Balneolaceae bacterium]